MNNKNFLSVINAVGEVLEKKEITISCQQYEIQELKKTIEDLEKKSKSNSIVLIHKD